MAVWVRKGGQCMGGSPSWLRGWWGAVAAAAAQHRKRGSYCVWLVQEKIQNRNSK